MHYLERTDCALEQWQLRPGDGTWVTWTLSIQWPHGVTCCPVLLSPDGCWPHCVNEEAAQRVNQEGIALAWFNRLELAFDPPDAQRCGPVFGRWPESGFGALSVWAWGMQRCIDALLGMARTDPGRIGVVGHSRGGKAALLAGATDTRIAATISNNSGTAGAASLLRSNAQAESLAALLARFPHWLGPNAGDPQFQSEWMKTDAPVVLMSNIAPRGLCLLQARDDLWANPPGTRHAFEQLQAHWTGPESKSRLRMHERDGGHAMTLEDWQNAARFLLSLP